MLSRNFLSPLIICLLTVGALSELSAESGVLKIHRNFSAVDVAPYLRVCPFELQQPEANTAACRAGTPESMAAAEKMRIPKMPMWSFLLIENTTKEDRVLVLEHHLAATAQITLQEIGTHPAVVRKAGTGIAVAERDYRTALPAFRILLKAEEKKTLRLSAYSNLSTRLGFTLFDKKTYFDQNQIVNIIYAAFYSLILSMIFYNLLLWLRLRLRMYVYYTLFTFSLLLIYLGLRGHGYVFIWPDSFTFQTYVHSFAKISAAVFSLAFFNELLAVKIRMPRLNLFAQLSYLIIMPSVVLAPFVSPQTFFIVATIIIAYATLYALVVGVLSAVGRLPFNIYYAIAMLTLVGGAIVNLLQTTAVLPSNTFTLHAMQFGTALETIFLSVALGDRYAAIENDNRVLQIQRLEDKKRIARDIHDVIGTEFQMRLIEIQAEGQGAPGKKIAEGLRATLDKIREFLFLLHTEENLPAKLEANIAELLERLEAAKGFEVEKNIRIVPGILDSAEAYHVERTVNEVVSNIARHAKARKIDFDLRIDERGGFLFVCDDGVGFDPHLVCDNIGMESLRYRAQRLGGRLRVSSAIGKGTKVALRFARS